MDRLDLWGMFILGLLGTGHCIGMCGPLIFAFPGRTGQFMPHVWYHLGRVTTYTALGGIMGGLGQMLTGAATGGATESLGWVNLIKGVLWLVAAALLMLFGVTRLGVIREPGWLTALAPERIPGFKRAMQGATEHPGTAVFYFLGLMLGFLPCGLSYGAFAQALGTGNAVQGTLLVLAFAVGTVPGLVLLGTGASAIFSRYRRQSDILSGAVMILMALKMGYKAMKMLL
jgi:sulfite exporter TauE/SafE